MSRTVNVLFDVTFLLNFPLFCLASIRAHIILTEKYLFYINSKEQNLPWLIFQIQLQAMSNLIKESNFLAYQ